MSIAKSISNENVVQFKNASGRAFPIEEKGLLGQIRNWIASFLTHRALASAEAELQSLDSRMLKDIGLHRSEVKSALIEFRAYASDPRLPSAERERMRRG